MQCNCCHADFAEGVAKCPACGFPALLAGDETEEYVRMLEDFRKKKLAQISVDMRVYSYDVSPSDVTETGSSWHILGNAAMLKKGEVLWSDLNCQPLSSERSFSVQIRICCGGLQQTKTVTFQPKKPVSRECIGLLADDLFTFRLAVGSKSDYILSDAIRMLL